MSTHDMQKEEQPVVKPETGCSFILRNDVRVQPGVYQASMTISRPVRADS